MTFLIVAVCSLTVLATALLIVGRRGRVVDDHPVCRRCGFDLVGAPAGSARCPECGADVAAPRNVRIGNRVPRRRLIAVAIPLLVVALLPAVFVGWVMVRGANLMTYKPVWLLMREAEGADLKLADPALAELDRRIRAGELKAGQAADVAERALARQGDVAQPWLPGWGDVIVHLESASRLTAAQKDQYVQQSLAHTIEIRPRVLRGGCIPLTIVASPRIHRLASIGPTAMRVVKLAIGPLEVTPAHWPLEVDPQEFEWTGAGFLTELDVPLSDEQWAQLAVGGRYDVRLFVERLDEVPVPDSPMTTRTVIVPLTLAAAEPAAIETPVPLRTDPSLRQAVLEAVTIEHVRIAVQSVPDGPPLLSASVAVSVDKLPAPAGWAVLLRADGREWPIGVIHFRAGATGVQGCSGDVAELTVRRADVVLRPSQAAARRAMDLTEIWGEEVVIPDQEVQYGRVRMRVMFPPPAPPAPAPPRQPAPSQQPQPDGPVRRSPRSQ